MRQLHARLATKCLMILGAVLLASGSNQIIAQTLPGSHPEYLHAIRNLREARELLTYNFQKPQHVQSSAAALQKIDLAIGELKAASHLDEKNMGDVPHDKDLPPVGRFHKVDGLLTSAWNDTNHNESDPAAMPYKNKALQHITDARGAIANCL